MNNNYSYNNYEPYHLKGTNRGDNLAYKDHKERATHIRDYTGHKSHKENTYGTHSYNIMENYQLNRNKDVYIKNDNPVLLDDREMFNKFSNNNDTEIDFNANNDKTNFRSVHIYNNKKNLINNPYIVKNSTDMADGNSMAYNDNTTYGSNYDNTTYGSNYDTTTDGSNYDTTFINDGTAKSKGKSKTNNNSFDKEYQRDFIDKSKINTGNVIEKDIIDDFIYNLSSCDSSVSPKVPLAPKAPYLLSYLIYSIILLSKNPTTDKLLQIYKIKSKDIAINEMKDISEDVSKYGDITYMVPSGCNNAFINKIRDIFNITVTTYDTDTDTKGIDGCRVTVYANFNYKLGIPMYHNPEIIYDYFDNDKKNKAKFIKLRNCIISHDYYKDDAKGGGGSGTVCIEILLEQTKLGFIFNSNKKSLNNTLPYHTMIKEKDFSITSKKVIIPQISNNIKDCNYNINNLENIHLGELLNGSLITPQLYLNTSLEIDILPTTTTSTPIITPTKKVEAIIINCDSYYYIKNENNKIIYIGLVHHNP
jgi:hypothetical protein